MPKDTRPTPFPGATPLVGGNGGRVAQVLDLFQRALKEGDEVILPGVEMKSPRYIIKAIKPVLDPRAKPDTLQLVLDTRLILTVEGDKAVAEFIRVRTAEEIATTTGSVVVPG